MSPDHLRILKDGYNASTMPKGHWAHTFQQFKDYASIFQFEADILTHFVAEHKNLSEKELDLLFENDPDLQQQFADRIQLMKDNSDGKSLLDLWREDNQYKNE